MKYLPFEDFEIHTDLSSDEAFYRLRAAVDTKRKWVFFTNKPFWGEVERNYFKIWRATWWNQNFRPIIYGVIYEDGSVSHLKIKMRMPWFAFVFYGLILCWLWFQYFLALANLIAQKIISGVWQIASPWMLLPHIFFFSFIYLISVGIFMAEKNNAKAFLLEIFKETNVSVKYQEEIFGISEKQILRMFFVLTLVVTVGWILYRIYF